VEGDRYASWPDRAAGADPLHEAHRVELAIWTVCAAVACCVVMHTLGLDFPARSLALEGEAVTLGVVVLLALASLRRALVRAATHKQSPRSQIAGVTLRVAFGVPVFLLALVASAAGFAA
jgi:hypothetical protein